MRIGYIFYCSFYLEFRCQIIMSRLLPSPPSQSIEIALDNTPMAFQLQIELSDPILLELPWHLSLSPTPFLNSCFQRMHSLLLLFTPLSTPAPLSVVGWAQSSVLGTLLYQHTPPGRSHWLPDGPTNDSQTSLQGNPLAFQTHASVHTAVPWALKVPQSQNWNHLPPKPDFSFLNISIGG